MKNHRAQIASPKEKSGESIYMAMWKIEQEHSRTRWTIATFFFSVSFAIFGLSFTTATPVGSSINHLQRIAGLVLYWFSFVLFYQFNRYTRYLRGRMIEMERKGEVPFTFQSDANKFMYGRVRRFSSATWLLFYFGLLYLGAVILLISLDVTLIKWMGRGNAAKVDRSSILGQAFRGEVWESMRK